MSASWGKLADQWAEVRARAAALRARGEDQLADELEHHAEKWEAIIAERRLVPA